MTGDPMQEFFSRQTELLRAVIGIYRQGHISLNTLIQRIEAIGNMIATDAWKNAVFPIILSIEQVNAPLVEAKKKFNGDRKSVCWRPSA
jgi:hypothetical protein